ncbi:hypothetical protein GCM10023238_33120 [Streptomyces heliomycini]
MENVPVDQLFPPTVQGEVRRSRAPDRPGPYRVGPDSGCEDAFDACCAKVLAPSAASACCAHYTARTEPRHHRRLLFHRGRRRRHDLPRRRFDANAWTADTDLDCPCRTRERAPPAAGFGDGQRATSDDLRPHGRAVVYAVTAGHDGTHRTVDTPQPRGTP